MAEIDPEHVISDYDEVRDVLSDDRFDVVTADPCDVVGTLAWLRAVGPRFSNGAEHEGRRALAVACLQRLDPRALRAAAYGRTRDALADVGRSGDELDAMRHLARAVPMATLAEALGFPDPDRAASAVTTVAAAYFGGADEALRRQADTATAQLWGMPWAGDTESVVARISLMVQACGGTAGLIGMALHALQDALGAPTDVLLADVIRRSPPVRSTRRVANTNVTIGDRQIAAGTTILCDLAAANHDAAAVEAPSLAFGFGIRPCPGKSEAMMLAAGVIDAVRDTCTVPIGQSIEFEPTAGLRIPQRLRVILR
jgi:cytochrome P450